MRDVEAPAGELGEGEVARDHHLLGGGRDALESEADGDRPLVHAAAAREVAILLVGDHRQVEERRVLERAAHEAGVHHRHAVVGDGDDARALHLADLRQALALESDRDGTDRMDARPSGSRGALEDVARHRAVVVHRVGVRHARDGGEAAGERGAHARRDRLLVLVARLAEVDVDVDEPGHDQLSRGVEHARVVPERPHRADGLDVPVLDPHVGRLDRPALRIDDRPPRDQQPLAHARAPPRRRAGSVSSASPPSSAASSALLRAIRR